MDAQLAHSRDFAALFERSESAHPQITIRHAFPPNWHRPVSGKWVHIQPWEFGVLPRQWLRPLREEVDEIWAPSSYVRDVYLRSGIPASKIQVISWGIDPEIYIPGSPPLPLHGAKSFKFLFVGGTIPRKGFDWVLDAFLKEFSPHEDVCLIVKDIGTKTFYRYGNSRSAILDAMANHNAPTVIYLDSEMTEEIRASLFTACDCLVAPYRGEGFGLPVLEAMASGVAPIIPRGGPTDDFTNADNAFYLATRTVTCDHDWELCGPATQLEIDVNDLRRAMRTAFENRSLTKQRGINAREHAHRHFSWSASFARMSERVVALAGPIPRISSPRYERRELAVCMLANDDSMLLRERISQAKKWACNVLIGDLGSTGRATTIAREAGSQAFDLRGCSDRSVACEHLSSMVRATWTLWLDQDRPLSVSEITSLNGVLNSALSNDSRPTSSGEASNDLPGTWRLMRSTARSPNLKVLPQPSIVARRRLKIGLVTVGYNLAGATSRLWTSAQDGCNHQLTLFLISHAQLQAKAAELETLAEQSNVVYRGYGTNRGLAKSWNEGILWGFETDQDVIVVVNEDVTFERGDLASLGEAAYEQRNKFLVMGRCYHGSENKWEWSEYGCFAFNRLALERLGCFDENFFPVYCEDSDYRRRAALAGLTPGYCEKTAIRHIGSGSLAQREVARQNSITYDRNFSYYVRKWGGPPGKETFDRPFNDTRFSYFIDPRVRNSPFPGFDRTDQSIVKI